MSRGRHRDIRTSHNPANRPANYFTLSWGTFPQDHIQTSSNDVQSHLTPSIISEPRNSLRTNGISSPIHSRGNSFGHIHPQNPESARVEDDQIAPGPIDDDDDDLDYEEEEDGDDNHLVHYSQIRDRNVLLAKFGEETNWNRTDEVNNNQMVAKPTFYVVPEKSLQQFDSEEAQMEWHIKLVETLKSDLETELCKFEDVAMLDVVRSEDVRIARTQFSQQVGEARKLRVMRGWEEPDSEELRGKITFLQETIMGVMEGRKGLEMKVEEKKFMKDMVAATMTSMKAKDVEPVTEDLISFDDDD